MSHVDAYGFVICKQCSKICRGLHDPARLILCSSCLIFSYCDCGDSLLCFLDDLRFGSKRCKLSDGIIVRRPIKAYDEFGIRVLLGK